MYARSVMRKFATVILLASASCAKIGAEEADKEPDVVLYGVDEGVPSNPPDHCKKKGRIEVSTIETEDLPETKLRNAAADIGANGVYAIRRAGREDTFIGEKRTYRAVAVRCPKAKPAAASASASAPAEEEK